MSVCTSFHSNHSFPKMSMPPIVIVPLGSEGAEVGDGVCCATVGVFVTDNALGRF